MPKKSPKKSPRKIAIAKFLDPSYVKRNTPNVNDLKVTVRKHKQKGVGLFATQTIRKGALIAMYRMTVFRLDTYRSPTKGMYIFTVYTKSGRESNTLIGDLSLESLPSPCRGVPFWAYFSNEPSDGEDANAWIDLNLEQNYKDRSRLKEGDTITYKLRAEKTIQKGEEILWCYGDSYARHGYTTPCSTP